MVCLGDPQMYHKMRNLSGQCLSRSKMIEKKLQTKKKTIKKLVYITVKIKFKFKLSITF